MAREDILTALQIALTQKEGPPPADDNTLIQKMIAPNETMTASDQGVTLTPSDPTKFVWGGNNAQGQYISPGWKWSQGEYYKSYKGVILNDNPLAYYRLDETSGTVAHDASGNGFNGTISGGVTLNQAGPLSSGGSSLKFDGVSGEILIPNNTSIGLTGNEIALEAWIYPTAYPGGDGKGTILTKNGSYYFQFQNNGTLQAYQYGTNPAGYQASTSTVALNQWTHVGYSYDGSELTFYINGQPAGTTSKTGNIASSFDGLSIGKEDGGSRYFVGYIAEPTVYSHSLSAQQWMNHYNARKAVFN